VDGGGAHELVMGSADASQVMNGQPGFDEGSGGSPWVLYTVPAPKPGPGVVLGLNVHDSEAATSPDHFADNVAVVLADPSADNLAWQVGDSTYGLAAVPMDHGFAEVDTGQVRARVLLTEVRAGSRVLAHNQFVGVPGAADSFAPQLAAVPAFTDVPTSGEDFGEVSGQGPSGFVDDSVVKRGPTTIYARCYGGAVITVSIDADTRAQTVRIPCDDVEHVIHGPALATSNLVDGKGHEWQVKASKLVAWRVAVRVTP
jgi:hypothetical protein